MADNFDLLTGLREVYANMSGARRRQLGMLLALMLLGAVAELATIGAVVPFIALLANPNGLIHRAWFYDLAMQVSGQQALGVATLIFLLFATLGGFLRLQLAWSTRSFIFSLGHDLSVEIQLRVLGQPYGFHTALNSSSLLAALNKTEMLCFDVLLPLIYALAASVIAISITAILLLITPAITLVSAVAFVALYLLIAKFTRGRLDLSSRALAEAFDRRAQVVQESLGGIRDVIIDGSQRMYVQTFEKFDYKLNAARTTNQFFIAAPRYLVEMGAIVVIAAIALFSAGRPGGLSLALPFLGALALGGQRLLPLLHQVYGGWSAVTGHRSIFIQVLELLRLPYQDGAFDKGLPQEPIVGVSLESVSFTYPARASPAIEDVELSIRPGSVLGLIGETGSGKSSLLDLIMGLLEPDKGIVRVNGDPLTSRNMGRWHRSIAHVPQSIFLIDSTIGQNIALSLPDALPDVERIVEAAKKARLHDFVQSLPAGYETYVGERGIRLSGGQRQRLGLARAIYKGAPVLILDEATSALDEETETAVMTALLDLRQEGRTIVIVAHRESTIRHCDAVAKLQHGRIVDFTWRSEEADKGSAPARGMHTRS